MFRNSFVLTSVFLMTNASLAKLGNRSFSFPHLILTHQTHGSDARHRHVRARIGVSCIVLYIMSSICNCNVSVSTCDALILDVWPSSELDASATLLFVIRRDHCNSSELSAARRLRLFISVRSAFREHLDQSWLADSAAESLLAYSRTFRGLSSSGSAVYPATRVFRRWSSSLFRSTSDCCSMSAIRLTHWSFWGVSDHHVSASWTAVSRTELVHVCLDDVRAPLLRR